MKHAIDTVEKWLFAVTERSENMGEGIAVHRKTCRQVHRQRAERDSHKGREIEWGWGEHVQRIETGNKSQSCCSCWSMYIKQT